MVTSPDVTLNDFMRKVYSSTAGATICQEICDNPPFPAWKQGLDDMMSGIEVGKFLSTAA